jgi:glutamate N-acetyltransferase/amino-acid N-acetyltransferase
MQSNDVARTSDGEGATKFVSVNVKNAASFEEAKKVATAIATSSLVKTAINGQGRVWFDFNRFQTSCGDFQRLKDANWGRILAAVGYSGASFDPAKVQLYMYAENDGIADKSRFLHLVQDGEPHNVDEEMGLKILRQRDIGIEVDLGVVAKNSSQNSFTMWTCDLSKEYVAINADYRS